MIRAILYCLTLVLLLGACRGTKPLTAGSKNIRVMTYNVHHANPPSRGKEVIELDTIAATIRRAGADLVALQELDSVTIRSGKVFQLKVLAEKLGMHYHYGKAIDYEGGGYGVGILSRYPIIEAQTVMLPKIEGFKGEDRVLAVAKVKLPGGKEIYFCSTHLDVSKAENRDLQAKAIVTIAKGLSLPVLLGGDLNATDDKASMKELFGYFTDASTQKAPTIPNLQPKRRIDYLLFAPGSLFTVKAERVLTGDSYGSDHLAFMAEFGY